MAEEKPYEKKLIKLLFDYDDTVETVEDIIIFIEALNIVIGFLEDEPEMTQEFLEKLIKYSKSTYDNLKRKLKDKVKEAEK